MNRTGRTPRERLFPQRVPLWVVLLTQLWCALMLIVAVDMFATDRPYLLYWSMPADDLLAHIHGDIHDEELGQHGRLLATYVKRLPIGPLTARALPPILGGAATVVPAPEAISSQEDLVERTVTSTETALVAATTLITERAGPGRARAGHPPSGPSPHLTLVDFDRLGASAGLMTALAFIDALGEGDLTGGRSIAGTGTITDTGRVVEIVGLPQKGAGAHAAGAEVMFVPTMNLLGWDEPTHPDLTIIPVSHLTDAVDWLCANGATDQICDLG